MYHCMVLGEINRLTGFKRKTNTMTFRPAVKRTGQSNLALSVQWAVAAWRHPERLTQFVTAASSQAVTKRKTAETNHTQGSYHL
jgi:hypothetical protein